MKWLSNLLRRKPDASADSDESAKSDDRAKPDKKRLVYSDEELKIFSASRTIGQTVATFALLGVIIILFWAQGAAPRSGAEPTAWAFFAADLLVAAAAAAAGALLGFIFGLPRTLEPADQAAIA